ncbi:MAG: glycosyltransferase family 4 protein [Candidatus Micrarchaeaceae archaeon]
MNASRPAAASIIPLSVPVESESPASVANPDKIRLLKFMTNLATGGTEKQVLNLIRRLDREKYEVFLGCLGRWGELFADIKNECVAIDEYSIKHMYGYKTFQQQLKFSRSLARRRIQIVHSYNFYANVFCVPAARFAGVPCVASIRSLGVYLTPMQCRVQNWFCRLADVVLVNAEAIRRWMLEQGFPEHKLRVIRNGVDFARFQGIEDRGALRQELGIPRNAPVVVMLSRLDSNKGADYFLEAAPQIVRLCPDAHFLVVGGGRIFDGSYGLQPDVALSKRLHERALQLGIGKRIHFTGMRSDVPDILSMATVSVLPSFSEGISNTLLESMAAGVAVVATNVGGTPEVVRNGHDGLLIPPGNARAIADAVSSILVNPLLATQLSVQGRERVSKSFTFDNMVQQTQEVYMEILESKAKSVKTKTV